MRSEFIFSLFTAILFTLAFPPFKYGFLAYWALVPFFYLLEGKSLKESFLWGYLTGLLTSVGTIYWITFVTLPGALATIFIHPLYFSLYAMIHTFLRQRFAVKFAFVLPFVWTGIEYLKSLGELGFPWITLGYTQTHYLALIQYASYTSVFGVTFWIVWINVLIYLILKNLADRKKVAIYLATTIALFVGPWFYGKQVIPDDREFRDSLRVALIQGNVDPYIKWEKENIEMSFDKYERLTREAAKFRPDLLIWPETATPTYLLHDARHLTRVRRLIEEVNIPLLTGLPDYIFISRKEYKTFNSAALLVPGNAYIPRYAKMHLVPFGERVPYEDVIPFFKNFIESLEMGEGNFSPGEKIVVFGLPGNRTSYSSDLTNNLNGHAMRTSSVSFAAVICFESIFPDLVQKFVQRGARFLVVITNDGWFGRPHYPWWLNGGLYQHAQMSVMRAIENRISVARCANTGVSMFIDPYGRVSKASSLFKDEYLVASIALRNETTFFTEHGNLFTRVISLSGLLFVVVAPLVKKSG